MLELYEQIEFRCARGETVALCTLVAVRGSTPQARGAKMLVTQGGQLIGTLGGGCVEAEVRKRALEQLAADRSEMLTFKLDHDLGWDDGMICGGNMDVLVQILRSPADAEPFAAVAGALRDGRDAELRLAYSAGGERREYVEQVTPTPTVLIVGAGHVGQALGELAHAMGFWIDVIDDRPEFANAARFPQARRRIVGEPEAELARYTITPNTYVVIVTRGHRGDGRALGAVVRSPAKYIGLIGSRRKIIAIMSDLEAAGVPRDLLNKVHAPIGLDIGGITVPEIALSIAAELVAVRRGRGDQPAAPLKMSLHKK